VYNGKTITRLLGLSISEVLEQRPSIVAAQKLYSKKTSYGTVKITESILLSVRNRVAGKLFFSNAPEGTGTICLINLLLASLGKIRLG